METGHLLSPSALRLRFYFRVLRVFRGSNRMIFQTAYYGRFCRFEEFRPSSAPPANKSLD
jgi:hypothetical protein